MLDYPDTRLWLGGLPVEFVRWGPHALVYVNIGSETTLSTLRRNTVQRLLLDGTLRIEGYRPDWADPDGWADRPLPRVKASDHH